MVVFIAIISVILFIFYFRDLKKNPITTKKIIFYVTNNDTFNIIW